MESDAVDGTSDPITDAEGQAALNSTILEYYKKFGRKRDLEQYFSLNTAQGDIKDLSSLFWRKMKSQENSDSGEKSRDSSVEVCRISIKCSAVDTDPGSSQDEKEKSKSESESPPIIVEEVTTPPGTSRHSDNESVKSDDNQSQKSMDVVLDTSMNRQSPTSSVTSQRKLEWDSLADVGYANESDKKTSVSSLSTLERLALKQQYSNNDTNQDDLMGVPTAHSTPVDENECKQKSRQGSKTTKIYRKDVDFVEVNIPQTSDSNPTQSINVNLTKHISLNVDNSGVSVENIKKDVSIHPEKRSVETEMTPHASCDKEIQTSLVKTQDKSSSSDIPKTVQLYGQTVPVLINLNTYKKKHRRKKFVAAKKKLRSRKQHDDDKENLPLLEKSNDQVSDAESFEYMPGHIYNQNQMNKPAEGSSSQVTGSNLVIGNKSSLESSGAVTTDSSKGSKCSFSKDLEKSIKLLKTTLNKRYDDSELKETLIKKVVQKLLQTSYKDDESSTDFLSGLSFSSKKIDLREGNTTSSTSDANNTTGEKTKLTRPKKSILRVDKFNSSVVASTSQSAPNLPVASNSEKPVSSNLTKTSAYPYTESASDSSKEKTSSDTAFAKTSSEELYQKYLEALRREDAYKKHLKEKENFLKQKLVCSELPLNVPATARLDNKSQLRLKELMKDLTRNNYDDGSGDASKLEGGLASNINIRPAISTHKSHSVFTLSSSGNSDQNRRGNLKKSEMKDGPKAGHSKEESHYCCCPHHYTNKLGVSDSSVQVDIKCSEKTCPKKPSKDPSASKCGKCKASQPITLVPDEISGEIKYLCMCNANVAELKNVPDNLLIYKCSRLMNQGVQSQEFPSPTAGSIKSTLRSKNYECKESQTCLKESVSSTKPKTRIREAVRIVQTNLSINPRISEPSLSDIKVINNCDCVKLVCEQYREISKTSIESKSSASEQRDCKIGACECSEIPRGTSIGQESTEQINDGRMNLRSVESQIQSDSDFVRETLYGEGESGDNMTIQGTNMTLKFTVGPNPPSELVGNCVMTQIDPGPRAMDTIFAQRELTRNDNLYVCPCPPLNPCSCPELHPCSSLDQNPCPCSEPKPTPRPEPKLELVSLLKKPSSRCTSPYPCPGGSECGNSCIEGCVKQVSRCTSPIRQPPPQEIALKTAIRMGSPRKSPREILPKKTPCGCPPTDKCGGYCGKEAACRKEKTYSSEKHLSTKSRCQCPAGSSCGNDCKTTCITKKQLSGSRQISPRSPQKSPRNLDANIKSQTYPHKYEAKKTKPGRSQSLEQSNMFKVFTDASKNTLQSGNQVTETTSSQEEETQAKSSTSERERKQTGSSTDLTEKRDSKDLIMNAIQEITNRYSKKGFAKDQKKKCFNEIVSCLNYFLDTEESTDAETIKNLQSVVAESSASDSDSAKNSELSAEVGDDRYDECENTKNKIHFDQCENTKNKIQYEECQKPEPKKEAIKEKVLVDKGVQQCCKKSKPVFFCTDSSDLPISSELPCTSSESVTCQVLNRIRRKCEKYHQRLCRCPNPKKCECSSTTSVNCEQCKPAHYCMCRTYKCKCKYRPRNYCERLRKKCVAYNLIIQTSESMVSEEKTGCDKTCRPLKSIIMKVPSRKQCNADIPFMESKFCSPRCENRKHRSRSLPNDSLSSTDDNLRTKIYCVKDYLEKNRPDFLEQSAKRQNRLKMISETRASNRAAQRRLVSMQLQMEPALRSVSSDDLRALAREAGLSLNKEPPKLLSEREMKQHSSRIYHRLPEVLRKREEEKKESIKKTNLLMANIFKKSLQKKTLRGSVNLSNYSTVIRI